MTEYNTFSGYIDIQYWENMYSKISEEILRLTDELANGNLDAVEYHTKNGELNGLTAIKHAFLDTEIKHADVVEVMHAHWDGIEGDGYAGDENGEMQIAYEVFECSHCGCEHRADGEPEWAFCPNCGARMEEGE